MEMFTVDALEELLRRFGIPEQTCQMIRRAVVAPERRVQTTPFNSPSRLPCPKMGLVMQSESRTVERKAVLHYLFDPDVLGYLDNPFSLDLIYTTATGKRIRHPYVVDEIVFYRSAGPALEEWKDDSEVNNLLQKNPGRYCKSQDGALRSPAAEAAAESLGLPYRIRLGSELSDIAYRNHDFLRSYLEQNARLAPGHKKIIEQAFQQYSYLTYAELECLSPALTRDDINYSIANGLVVVDMSSTFVGDATNFMIFRDLLTLQAYCEAQHNQNSGPHKQWSPDLFSPGAHVSWDGETFSVLVNGALELHLKSDRSNTIVSLPHNHVERLFLAGSLIVEDAGLTKRTAPLALENDLRLAAPDKIRCAIQRHSLLQNWKNNVPISAGKTYSDRTYREWSRKESEALANGKDPIVALIPKTNRRGNYGPKIPEGADVIIEQVLEKHYDQLIGRTKWSVFGTLCNALEAGGYAPISKPTFLRRTKQHISVEVIGSRRGRKAAYQAANFAWILDIRSPVHGDYPFHIVHIDHTELEIELRSSRTGENLGRPWLTLAVCARTRRILGFYLSYRRPRYIACMAVLCDLVQRHGRVPDIIVADGGAEFSATDYEELLGLLHIEALHRPSSAARAGSICERLFGYAQSAFIHNLIGNTKLRRNVRELSPETNPSKLAIFTLRDLYEGLDEWFFQIYDTRKHPSLLTSPRVAFEQGLIDSGMRLHRLKRIEDLIPIAFPSARGRFRTLDPQRGIYVNNRYYRNPRLEIICLKGVSVQVKPHLLRSDLVYALHNGEWFPCYANNHVAAEDDDDFSRRMLYEEWVIEQRLVEESDVNSCRRTATLVDHMNSGETIANEVDDASGSVSEPPLVELAQDENEEFVSLINVIKSQGNYERRLDE